MAIKILDAGRASGQQDFLLVTSGEMPAFGRLLLPATGFLGRPYSSVLSYRIGRQVVVVGALPEKNPDPNGGRGFEEIESLARTGSLRFRLAVALLAGEWREVGVVEVAERLDDQFGRALRFDPWNTADDIEPIGVLNGLREAVYPAAQSARERGTPRQTWPELLRVPLREKPLSRVHRAG